MTDPDPRIYERVMFYSVEINPGIVLEVDRLDSARDLFRNLRLARSESGATLNLIAWAGRSARDGGPPTGLILEQTSWRGVDE